MNRPTSEAAELRRRAEAQIALGDLPAKLPLDPTRLLHELQVHKIELELQNEELLSANRELDTLRRRYQAMFEHAPVGYLILSMAGVIDDLNERAVELLKRERKSLLNLPMRDHFDPASVADFDVLLRAVNDNENDTSVSADNLILHRPRSVPIFVRAQARRLEAIDHAPPFALIAIMDVSALKYAMDDAISRIEK